MSVRAFGFLNPIVADNPAIIHSDGYLELLKEEIRELNAGGLDLGLIMRNARNPKRLL